MKTNEHYKESPIREKSFEFAVRIVNLSNFEPSKENIKA